MSEHPTVSGYRLDFYCPEARLAVEVDGPSHWGRARAQHDATRDEVHLRMGIRTAGFSAAHVEADPREVAAEVERRATERIAVALPAPVVPVAAPDAEPWTEAYPEDLGWSTPLPACRPPDQPSVAARPPAGPLKATSPAFRTPRAAVP